MAVRSRERRPARLTVACLLCVALTFGFFLGTGLRPSGAEDGQESLRVRREDAGARQGQGRLLVLSTYFCSKVDFQRKIAVQRDSFEYIAPLYSSVLEQDNAELVIFHDGQSQAFVDRWTTPRIHFIQVELRVTIEMNDERFLFYEEYLASSDMPLCEYVLMADVSDVRIVGDLVTRMADRPAECTLLVSQERQTVKAAQWLFGYPSSCYNKPKNYINKHLDMKRRLYNAGVLCGRLEDVRVLLDRLVREFARMDHHDANCNMAVLQFVLQNEYSFNELCGDGACWEDLCGESPIVIAHKWPSEGGV